MFIKSTRDDGTTFYTLADGAPEGLLEAIREAHHGTLPNDWIYEECKAAFEGDLTDSDALHEYADGRVSIYTKELFQWNADMCLTALYRYAEDEASDLGGASIEDRVKVIQFCAIRMIASVIAEWKASQ